MREHAVMSIQKFLESRIEADERLTREATARTDLEDSRLALTDDGRVSATGSRVLSEVALKREMLFCHDDDRSEAPGRPTIVCVACREPYPCQSLRIAAAVYSDHPRYLPEWRPDDPDPRTDRTAVERLLVALFGSRRLRRNADAPRTRLPVASLWPRHEPDVPDSPV
jgi:hypothetical protein